MGWANSAWVRHGLAWVGGVLVLGTAACQRAEPPPQLRPAEGASNAVPPLFLKPQDRQPNLVNNGSFEAGQDGAPVGWTLRSSQPQSPWARQTLSVSGAHAAQLTLSTPGEATWQQLVSGIDPAVRYRMRSHVHASDVEPGSHGVEVQWLDSEARVVGTSAASARRADGWDEVTLHDLSPPEDAVAALVRLRASAPGTYHFDDVVLTRQDELVYEGLSTLPLSVFELTSINLLSNSGMELRRISGAPEALAGEQRVCQRPDRCELPAFWSAVSDGVDVEQWWERLGSRAHALKTVLKTAVRADWQQSVPDIDPARTYRLMASVHVSDASPGTHGVEVQWQDATRQPLGSVRLVASEAGAWSRVGQSGLRPPPGTTSALVMLRAEQPGTYLFDNVTLEVDWSNPQRLEELRHAGFTLASAFGPSAGPGLPTLDEVGQAGLRALYRDVHLVAENDTDAQRIRAAASAVAGHPALSLWFGPDEPAWEWYRCVQSGMDQSGLCPDFATAAYRQLVGADAYWQSSRHGVWLNHAPRGSLEQPRNFSLLRPYNNAADILSMDIYPVPAGYGHSNLDERSLRSVGQYTDILYQQVATERGRQSRPIWMVLQGFGWYDLLQSTIFDGGDTLYNNTAASLEVHWLDATGRPVTQRGPDGVAYQVIAVLQTDRPNSWRHVREHGLVPPLQARHALVRLRTFSPGTYWFDDVALVEEGGSNLLVNGSFEEGSRGLPDGWSTSPTVPEGRLRWDSSQAHTGSASVRVELDTRAPLELWQEVPVDPARRYHLEGALYARTRPTWTETRFMAYSALIHGARGLVWWGNQTIPYNAELWTDLKRLAGELNLLGPALVAPAPFRQVSALTVEPTGATTTPSSVEAALLQAGTELYLIAANTADGPTRARLQVDGLTLTSAERLFDEGGIALQGNALTDPFAAHQVRVYRLR